MAYLLGSKSCLDSLRIDIEDLQNIIYDILNKTGSIKCYSWKFPDQLATDVQIKDLLQRHQFSTNELDNQVSHIILFEILIDRLLLILQGSWKYFHDIEMKYFSNQINSSLTIDDKRNFSIGLIVKNFWYQFIQFLNLFEKHQFRIEIQRKKSKSHLITIDKHCQTIQTSFILCSSCEQYQKSIQQLTNQILNLFNILNLPSSIAFHRCSTSIISQCLSSEELNNLIKDFDCLSKHFQDLINTNNQMKNDSKINEENFKEQIQQLENMIHNEQQTKKLLENKFINMKKTYDEQLKKFNELILEKNSIQNEIQSKSQINQFENIESMKIQMKILTDARIQSDQERKLTEENCIRLQTEVDILKRELDQRQNDLKKERIRIEKFIRQDENLQSKEKSLMENNQQIIHEYQLLKDQFENNSKNFVDEINELKTNLIHRTNECTLNQQYLYDMKNQLRIKDEQINNLHKENQTLKISLEKLQTTIINIESTRNLPPPQSYYTYVPPVEPVRPRETSVSLLDTEIVEQQAFTEPPKPVTSVNYIPRFSENDYAANGWIKLNSDVVQIQSRPVTHLSSTRPIPPAIDHEMIIGKGRTKVSNRPLSFEHTRRNHSSTRTRRSSTTNITHKCTN